jgi:hypothetical protein
MIEQMNTDQEKNKLSVREIHPWAQNGDAGKNLRAGIIQVPEDLKNRLQKSQPKNPDELQKKVFQNGNEIVDESVALATIIENIPTQKTQENQSHKELLTSPEQCINDCIGLAKVIDQIRTVAASTQQDLSKPDLPDEDILNSISCLPLIFPSPKPRKNQEPAKVKSKKSSESNAEYSNTSTDEFRSKNVSTGSSGFKQVKSESQEKSINQISETKSDLKKSSFLSWLQEKNRDSDNREKAVDAEEEKKEMTDEEKIEKQKKIKKEKKKRKKAKKKAKKAKKKAKKERKKKEKARKKRLKELLNSSTEIGDEIASETLAKLLAHQGHTERAIEMYEKLILLFPKKSSYFAEIIENLEEK